MKTKNSQDSDLLKSTDRIRMYTLVPGASGTIKNWIEKLPAIANMGFNKLHLLPITHMSKSESPYAAYDLFTIDPRYLNPNDSRDGDTQFRDFIAALKHHRIGLCVDLVFNHIGVESLIAEEHPDWLAKDAEEQDGIKRAGWQGADQFHKWLDLALLDYECAEARTGKGLWNTMLRYAMYWTGLAAETGGVIRLDNLHSSHPKFMKWAMGRIRKEYPKIIVLAELFTDEVTIQRITKDMGLNIILATQWEHPFVPELRQFLIYLHKTSYRIRYYFPISSHDSGVPAKEYGDVRSTVPRMVMSVLLGPGPTGIVQGVEHGVQEQIRFIGGPSEAKLSSDIDFSGFIRSLFDLVDRHPAFGVPGNLTFIDEDHIAIMAGVRFDPATQRAEILIFVNFDIYAPQTLTCDLNVIPEGEVFIDIRSGESVQSGKITITLEAGAYRVFVRG